jgi:hypothetical protein
MVDKINVVVNPSNPTRVTVKPNRTVLVNQSGIIATRKLSDLLDVDVSAKKDGSLLIYDEEQEKFVASTLLEKQIIDGGTFDDIP